MIVCVVTTASLGWVPNSGQDHQSWYLMAIVYNQISDHQTEIVIVKRFHMWLFHLLLLLFCYFTSPFHLILITFILSYFILLHILVLSHLSHFHIILFTGLRSLTA